MVSVVQTDAGLTIRRHANSLDPCRFVRRGGRVVEGARLESVFTANANVGSNPTLSANSVPKTHTKIKF